jgi:hypothetical protein
LDSGERKAWTAACRAAAARSQRTERTRAGAGRAAAHHIECERRRKFGAARVTVNNLPLNRKASWCHGISLWRQQFFACGMCARCPLLTLRSSLCARSTRTARSWGPRINTYHATRAAQHTHLPHTQKTSTHTCRLCQWVLVSDAGSQTSCRVHTPFLQARSCRAAHEMDRTPQTPSRLPCHCLKSFGHSSPHPKDLYSHYIPACATASMQAIATRRKSAPAQSRSSLHPEL